MPKNTFYHGDCKLVLSHDIEPESVDLIYLDPPFFTGKTMRDKWEPGNMEISYEDSKRFWGDSEKVKVMRLAAPEWLKQIAYRHPELASYLYYMMERLELCKKALKGTGSIYLHCDYRASHYLRMVMDEIFGMEQLGNEIIWCYSFGGTTHKYFNRKHQTILYYHKGNSWTFNEYEVKREATSAWSKGSMCTIEDWWHIPNINNNERLGYPTQKPIALLERIVAVSSNKGELVLDPFAGCGTTIIAAQKLNRFWIGIDLNNEAYGVLQERFRQLPLEAVANPAYAEHCIVCRDLPSVKSLDSSEFEFWANEYHKATKPSPDRGIDGITPAGIAIQSKAWQSSKVNYEVVNSFYMNTQIHPTVPKPINTIKLVSQWGFDDSARKAAYEIETKFGVKVELKTPEDLLSVNEKRRKAGL